jgi:diadenosine tetraphosphate (Ap4A) HIT family hydrolase
VTFALDPRLAADTIEVGDLSLSRVLLRNDARFSWLILVPRRAGLIEIVDLETSERATLIEEIALAGEALRALPDVAKINIGALGNIVRQLHVHVVARRLGDAAWPGPVWGAGAARRYEDGAGAQLVARIRRALAMDAGLGHGA